MKDLLIVVPYRNREEHLKGFLENSPRYFNEQNFTYDILICELDQQGDWNAGLSCNSLINFISSERQYKYLYIHHVDIWPTSGQWEFPLDKQVFHNLGDYGSCLMKMDDFLAVGGYSNSFWGWGGEDNDLFNKFRHKGFNVIDKNDSSVKYETKHQGHERKFNGANYAGGIKNLCLIPEERKNNITHFAEHGLTQDLVELSMNVFKHVVVPLQTSPDKATNKDVLITYLKGHSDPHPLMPYIKTSMMFSAYEYDVVFCIADETPNSWLLNQLESFGIKYFLRKQQISSLFVDRFDAYTEFLSQHSYDKVLHTDSLDVFFQSNPFAEIQEQLLILTEEIPIIDEQWNYTSLCRLYSGECLQNIKDRDVLCSGVIGGPVTKFVDFCKKLVLEYSKLNQDFYGIDQPIAQKIIYTEQNDWFDIKNIQSGWGINLHCPAHYPERYKDKIHILNNKVLTKDHRPFSIVHQYNRISNLYQTIQSHFGGSYYPIF